MGNYFLALHHKEIGLLNIDIELICVQEDKAADIMLKVVACARILMYNTF